MKHEIIGDLVYKTEEDMQKELDKRIKNYKKGYSRDGYVEKARGEFSYRNVKFLIIILRYFDHTNRFKPIGDRLTDSHALVEYPLETKQIADLISSDYHSEFLYHDTLHSFNDKQTLDEQIELCKTWAKEDIDILLNGTISLRMQSQINKIRETKKSLNKLIEKIKHEIGVLK